MYLYLMYNRKMWYFIWNRISWRSYNVGNQPFANQNHLISDKSEVLFVFELKILSKELNLSMLLLLLWAYWLSFMPLMLLNSNFSFKFIDKLNSYHTIFPITNQSFSTPDKPWNVMNTNRKQKKKKNRLNRCEEELVKSSFIYLLN